MVIRLLPCHSIISKWSARSSRQTVHGFCLKMTHCPYAFLRLWWGFVRPGFVVDSAHMYRKRGWGPLWSVSQLFVQFFDYYQENGRWDLGNPGQSSSSLPMNPRSDAKTCLSGSPLNSSGFYPLELRASLVIADTGFTHTVRRSVLTAGRKFYPIMRLVSWTQQVKCLKWMTNEPRTGPTTCHDHLRAVGAWARKQTTWNAVALKMGPTRVLNDEAASWGCVINCLRFPFEAATTAHALEKEESAPYMIGNL